MWLIFIQSEALNVGKELVEKRVLYVRHYFGHFTGQRKIIAVFISDLSCDGISGA